MFSKLILALAAVASASALVTVPRASTVVVSPPITSPEAGDVWPVGSVQTVTWDTSGIPAGSSSWTGEILLGYVEEGSTNEHLDIRACTFPSSMCVTLANFCACRRRGSAEHPLAQGFLLTAGAVNVTVPDVTTRNDYVVARECAQD